MHNFSIAHIDIEFGNESERDGENDEFPACLYLRAIILEQLFIVVKGGSLEDRSRIRIYYHSIVHR
jgi:hypothetical protein